MAAHVLPPLLYLQRGEVSDSAACTTPTKMQVVSRMGHVWTTFSAVVIWPDVAGRRSVRTILSMLDRFGRVRCAMPGRGRDLGRAVLGERHTSNIASFCTWHNASLPHLRIAAELKALCKAPLGVLAPPDVDLLDPQEVNELRPIISLAFPGHPDDPHSAAAHDVVEQRALKWRWGTVSLAESSCTRGCCVECGFCAYQDQLDLPWLLGDLLLRRIRRRSELGNPGGCCSTGTASSPAPLNFLNFGCGALEEYDPLAAFIFGREPWPVQGLCVDMSEAKIAEASSRLQSAGVAGVALLRFTLSPDPASLSEVLRAGEERCLFPIDVLKVDVDSFDVELAVATVAELHRRGGADMLPAVLVVEVNPLVPPPFELLTHFSQPLGGRAARQAYGSLNSLSAAIAQLWAFGYRLHRLAYLDAVFVHEAAAVRSGMSTFGAQDEWACYLQSVMFWDPGERRRAQGWLLSTDQQAAESEILQQCHRYLLRKAAESVSVAAEDGHLPLLSFGFQVGVSERSG